MKKILVIDDEAPVARLIGAALTSAGVEHTIDYCSDGGQGRARAAQGQHDLITLDLHMPLMGGMEALKEIKQNPKSAAIPVVVITAQQDSAFHKRAKEFGAATVVPKPFRPDDLGSILSQVLAGADVELPEPRGEQDDELRPLDV